jgi:hypothetical protein
MVTETRTRNALSIVRSLQDYYAFLVINIQTRLSALASSNGFWIRDASNSDENVEIHFTYSRVRRDPQAYREIGKFDCKL